MKLDITPSEQGLIVNALEGAAKSAKRAFNTAKQMQLREFHSKYENDLNVLRGKIQDLK